MHRDADEPRVEPVESLVREARENWGTTTDHERLQATGQAELHLEADRDGDPSPAPEEQPGDDTSETAPRSGDPAGSSGDRSRSA